MYKDSRYVSKARLNVTACWQRPDGAGERRLRKTMERGDKN